MVCRELGHPTDNAYQWLTPRWDYNPRIRILKTYAEPRECRGDETRLDACELRLSGRLEQWQCEDNEHFNYIHCGTNETLTVDYIGNWGGILFARGDSLEAQPSSGVDTFEDASLLRHVEIVGAGRAHNDSLEIGALQVLRRSPVLENVNVTNSSMHGIQVRLIN